MFAPPPQYPSKLWYFWTWIKAFFAIFGAILIVIFFFWLFVDVLFLGGPR